MKKLTLALLILLSTTYSYGYAESNNATRLDPYVVEVSRSETNYKKLPASIDVITSRDLEIKPKTDNFYDAIKNVTGVHTDQGSGMGWATIMIRGETPSVLVDGVDINPYISATPFNIFTAGTGAIERIEVLRGTQAASQGSGAMSGAINVVMKKGDADNPYVKLDLDSGSNNTQNGAITVSGGKDKLAWIINYAQKYADDYDTPKGEIPYTESRYKNLYARLDFLLTNDHEIGLETTYADGKYQTGGAGYYYLDDTNRKIWQNEPKTTSILGKYNGDFDRFNIKTTVGYIENNLDYIYGNSPYDVPSFLNKTNTVSYKEQAFVGDIRSRIEVVENELLSAHLNYSHKTTDAHSTSTGASVYDYKSTQHQNSFTGQLESKPTDYALLTAGARHDAYDRDGKTTDNLSTNCGISIYPFAKTDYDWTTLWASYSEAFKTPPANYLYMPAAMGANPDLKNERSEGWEIGIKQDISHWASFSLSYFKTEYHDRIVFDLAAFKLNNVGKSNAQGYEAEISIYPTDYLTLYSNYIVMERIDQTIDERLYSSPNPDSKLVFGAMVDNFYNFSMGIEGAHYIDFKLSDGSRHPSEGKTVFDAKLSYKMEYDRLTIEPHITATNITDEVIYSAGDTAGIQPGRSILCGVGLQYNF
ncbi:TonB-dependent receptor [Pseudodesulfovibrio sp. F-1]|uniref:TonB-dependent receptor n=1 Tax=Pseudodesulfovibrio alkaliphilus TaxID=2661613 RepID=A0A7K1KSG1_9BACT|nr:TonB-dependent receptor [Pseudodesulfovibrio alkaliphilus]MUM78821.1 TonB-dependent receptor [Pseudodesulfovibrio alkaliphilus]